MLDKTLAAYTTYKTKKEERKKLEIERKMIIDEREHTLKIKRIDLEEKCINSGKLLPDKMEQMSMEQMEKSWKDEFIMLILFLPIIIAFIPGIQDVASSGFQILKDTMPQWYSLLLLTG